jgi:tetratricopeptide (TPR) repeat protein
LKIAIPDSRKTLAALVVFAAIAVYVNSLANGFAFDDVFIIEDNARAHDPTNLRQIWLTPYWPFLGPELGLYRPGAIFLYAIQWAVGDGAPWLFHAVNIGLHAVASVLVFFLLAAFTRNVPAMIGALVFAVHPVHTEAVANVVGQAEIVAAIAVLSACILHARRPPGIDVPWPNRLALVLLFLGALFTKESAVVLPALLVLMDFAQGRVPLSRHGIERYVRAMFIPLFLMVAALACYLLIRFDVMGGSLIGVDAAPSMPYIREEYRLLNALRAFPEFLRLLFFPQELAADYSPGVLLPVDDVRPMVILGGVLLVFLAILAVLTPWLPRLGFPAAWFLISILTVSNLFFPIGVLVAERTLYLPSVALSALVAFAWHAGTPRASPVSRRIAVAGAACVLLLFGVRTWIRNPDWKDTPAVWDAIYRDHPYSYRAQWVQASLAYTAGYMDVAEQRYRMARRIYSRDSQFMADYANFMMTLGRYDEAVPILEEARRSHAYVPQNAVILAYAYIATGRYREALDMALAAETLGPVLGSTLPIRAYAYAGLGDHDRAIGTWRVAVERAPGRPWRRRAFLARALALGGYTDDALAELAAAREATDDTTAHDAIDLLEAAIREGCYAGAAAQPVAPGAAPECDPLGEWFPFVPDVQNATPLQNASTGVRAGPGRAPPE